MMMLDHPVHVRLVTRFVQLLANMAVQVIPAAMTVFRTIIESSLDRRDLNVPLNLA